MHVGGTCAGLGYRDVESHRTLRAVEVKAAAWANGETERGKVKAVWQEGHELIDDDDGDDDHNDNAAAY